MISLFFAILFSVVFSTDKNLLGIDIPPKGTDSLQIINIIPETYEKINIGKRIDGAMVATQVASIDAEKELLYTKYHNSMKKKSVVAAFDLKNKNGSLLWEWNFPKEIFEIYNMVVDNNNGDVYFVCVFSDQSVHVVRFHPDTKKYEDLTTLKSIMLCIPETISFNPVKSYLYVKISNHTDRPIYVLDMKYSPPKVIQTIGNEQNIQTLNYDKVTQKLFGIGIVKLPDKNIRHLYSIDVDGNVEDIGVIDGYDNIAANEAALNPDDRILYTYLQVQGAHVWDPYDFISISLATAEVTNHIKCSVLNEGKEKDDIPKCSLSLEHFHKQV